MTASSANPVRRCVMGGEVIIAVLLLLTAVGGAGLYAALRMSLPVLKGTLPVAHLSAPVRITRDERGVPTIEATTRRDRVIALGVIHAQERFFQMDLLRRTASGELAALFGPVAIAADRGKRLHRLRARAHLAWEHLAADEQEVLLAYADGVNQGLQQLGSRPFEYWLLRSDPVPWQPEDSLLVVYAMYFNLQDETAARDNTINLLRTTVGADAADFFVPRFSEWDATLDGHNRAATATPARTPAATWPVAASSVALTEHEDAINSGVGSNNFALAGGITRSGSAMVAGDMHLELRVPNIWYRASWVIGGGNAQRVTGVTLPGLPVMVAGSNQYVAWTFTNSYLDVSDLVAFDWDEPGATVRSAQGSEPVQYFTETIAVRGADPEPLLVVETPWGPVLDADSAQRFRAVRWIAHDVHAVNLGLLKMETAHTVDEALAFANAAGMPAQNIVAADRDGHIGWSIAGPLPDRIAEQPGGVLRGDNPAHQWRGIVAPRDYPRRRDPDNARLWTANSRVLEDPLLDRVGDGGYVFGARARQIRDGLAPLRSGATETDLLAIQLDDRALLLERWRTLLLGVLDASALAGHPAREELRSIVLAWSGHADTESAAYRIVRAFRVFAADLIFGALFKQAKLQDARFDYRAAAQWEEPLWRMIDERAAVGLVPGYASWDEQLLGIVDEVLRYFSRDGASLTQQTWGARNTLSMDHPIARAVPRLRSWLGMPQQPLPGDIDMPRVQGVDFGASQRMVVSPGHEENGIFHMPGGQSGHPLSPFYRLGHDDWARAIPAPFLPGQPQFELTLFNPSP